LHVNTRRLTQVLTVASLTAALGACSATDPAPAAQPPTSAPTTTSASAPTTTAPTADPAAEEALPLLVREQGAQTSALAPAVGRDSPDLAVLASTTDEISTTISFWAWDGTAFQPAGNLTAGEPLLAQKAPEWHHLTGGSFPDAVVYLQGGSMSGGVDAVIARHEADGSWRFVPLEGQSGDGIAVEEDVYARNPVFDEGSTFVTRALAPGAPVVVAYWRYEEIDGKNWFTRSSPPDPGATATP
jgi:hypothetical protein